MIVTGEGIRTTREETENKQENAKLLLIPILCKHLNFYIRGLARMVMDFVQIMHNWCTLCKNQKMTKSWLLWPTVAMATTIIFSLTENTGF